MSAQNKGEVTLTFFYLLYIYIIKNSNMKSKLFLEEGEIARILNMHKKAIQEQINVNGDEVENNQVQMDEELYEENTQNNSESFTLPFYYELEPKNKLDDYELKLMKGLTFKKSTYGMLKAVGAYQYSDSITGTVSDIDMNTIPMGVKTLNKNTFKGTVSYNCTTGKFKSNYDSDEFFDEDGKLVPFLVKLCQNKEIKPPVGNGGGGNVTTKSKCPKIEKSFLDKGYVMITQKRYQELANDKTRVRKYAWCPISKTNLFFGKVIQGQGTPEKGGFPGGGNVGSGNVGGGSGGGGSVSFDYDSVIKSINDKCPGGGGGGGNANLDIDIDGEKVVPTPKMPMDVYNAIG